MNAPISPSNSVSNHSSSSAEPAIFKDVDIESLRREFQQELVVLADWWVKHSIDKTHGGFLGEINNNNEVKNDASKGIILNARILWFFSEVSCEVENSQYRYCADRAYNYLMNYFYDDKNGGFYWELNFSGKIINDKKQIYAQAFVIYALSAYYRLTKNEQVLNQAIHCFDLVEHYGIDKGREGYLEAFSRNWQPLDDVRLSEKDLNFPKTQNTHLHILEAYTGLYNVCPTRRVKDALVYNIQLFDRYMINKDNYHLRMFMDLEWNDFSSDITYGHDIEASWLIARALEASGDCAFIDTLTPTLINIVETTYGEAIGSYGQVIDSYNLLTQKINPDNVWWVQAEALVGFLYGFVTTENERYLFAAKNVWQFIKNYQIDKVNGEWFWLSTLDEKRTDSFPKLGFWKCPYHNGRAMIEAVRYIHQYTRCKN